MEIIIFTDSKKDAVPYEFDRIISLSNPQPNYAVTTYILPICDVARQTIWMVEENINGIKQNNVEQIVVSVGQDFLKRGNFQFLRMGYCLKRLIRITNSSSSSPPPEINHEASFFPNDHQQPTFTVETLHSQETIIHTEVEMHLFMKNKAGPLEDLNSFKSYIFRTDKSQTTFCFIHSESSRQMLKGKTQKSRNDETKTWSMEDKIGIKNNQIPTSQKTQCVHKFLLFLFFGLKKREIKANLSKKQHYSNSKTISISENHPSIEAVINWKCKFTEKSNEKKQRKLLDAIRYELEMHKFNFNHHLSFIENYLGTSINIEKLLAEESEHESIGSSISQGSVSLSSHHNRNARNSKTNAKGEISTIQESNQKVDKIKLMVTKMPLSLNGEFKRIKEISESIEKVRVAILLVKASIQNQESELKQKRELKKATECKNLKQMFHGRKELAEIKSEIERKRKEIETKSKENYYQALQEQKRCHTSKRAEKILIEECQHLKKSIDFQFEVEQLPAKCNSPRLQNNSASTLEDKYFQRLNWLSKIKKGSLKSGPHDHHQLESQNLSNSKGVFQFTNQNAIDGCQFAEKASQLELSDQMGRTERLGCYLVELYEMFGSNSTILNEISSTLWKYDSNPASKVKYPSCIGQINLSSFHMLTTYLNSKTKSNSINLPNTTHSPLQLTSKDPTSSIHSSLINSPSNFERLFFGSQWNHKTIGLRHTNANISKEVSKNSNMTGESQSITETRKQNKIEKPIIESIRAKRTTIDRNCNDFFA